jgi:hypothetical protein
MARDTARDSRDQARDTRRDAREQARDVNREYRDDRQDARRDARESSRDERDTDEWRSDLRDDVRDFARDAADFGRRTAREAMDTARDTSRESGDAERQWNEFGRETAQEWRDSSRRGTDFARQESDYDRDWNRNRDARSDRGSSRDADFDNDSQDSFARDEFRERDDRDSFAGRSSRGRQEDQDDRDRRQSNRSSDRDERFTDRQSNQRRDTRISRSQIENFRASSVEPRDLGLSFQRSSRGLIVNNIGSNAIAGRIGLRRGDRILAIEDYRVSSEDQFINYLFDDEWRHDRVEVTVMRNGREVPLYVRPVQLIEQLVTVQRQYDPLRTFGVVFEDDSDEYLVVRQVWQNTPAYRAGLRAGDRIVRFYGQPVYSPHEFTRVLSRVDAQNVPLEIERDRRTRELQVSLPAELRTTSQNRTTYRQTLQDSRPTQWREQGRTIQYGGRIYDQGTSATPSSGVIINEQGQTVFPAQPAQPVQPGTRTDTQRERPGLLPRLLNR